MPIDPSLYLGFQVSHLHKLGTGFDSLISKTVNLSELDGPLYAATFAGSFRYGIPADPEEDKAIKYPFVLMAAANTRSRKTRVAAELQLNPKQPTKIKSKIAIERHVSDDVLLKARILKFREMDVALRAHLN